MLKALERGLSEAEETDLDTLTSSEKSDVLCDIQRQKSRLDALEAKVIAKWDAERCWQLDNAKSGAAWLAWKTRLPKQDTGRKVRHARFLRQVPVIADAWEAGEIDRSHITTLIGACNPRTAAAFAEEHKMLLDTAKTLSFADFKRVCDYWTLIADPDGAEQGADAQDAAREVHLAQTMDGMWYGRITYDPIRGTIVSNCLERFEREMFEADWAEAKARLGRKPTLDELARTPAQRRADALVEMARRAQAMPKDARLPVPLFTVVVGYETFAGPIIELWNRTVVTPGAAAEWVSDADIERIVFDGPSRVVDVGAKRRFARGALRRAIEVRDRTCFHVTCDEVPDRPEIDHAKPASKDGPTTQRNLRLGCRFHNNHRDHDDESDWPHEDEVFPTWDDAIDQPDGPDPPETT